LPPLRYGDGIVIARDPVLSPTTMT